MINVLYFLLLIEASIGGGGRIFALGPITLRMFFFGAGLAAWLAISMIRRRLDGQGLAFLIVIFFFISLVPGIIVDVGNRAPAGAIISGILPLFFWVTAPFFAAALKDRAVVQKSAQVIIFGGFAVACITLAVMAGLFTGIIPFMIFYSLVADSGEFFFRNNYSFFYKGHFYVAIALIFTVVLKPRHWLMISVALGLTIFLSLTRSFIFATPIAIILALVATRQAGLVVILMLISVAVAGIYSPDIVELLFGDTERNISISVRSEDLDAFRNNFDASMLLFGDGASALLNNRSDIENSYLWAIWRFGTIGILFLVYPLIISFYYYKKIDTAGEYFRLASAFFYGMVMLYIVTSINPFINNSIGTIYALVAVFSLRQLSRQNKVKMGPGSKLNPAVA